MRGAFIDSVLNNTWNIYDTNVGVVVLIAQMVDCSIIFFMIQMCGTFFNHTSTACQSTLSLFQGDLLSLSP